MICNLSFLQSLFHSKSVCISCIFHITEYPYNIPETYIGWIKHSIWVTNLLWNTSVNCITVIEQFILSAVCIFINFTIISHIKQAITVSVISTAQNPVLRISNRKSLWASLLCIADQNTVIFLLHVDHTMLCGYHSHNVAPYTAFLCFYRSNRWYIFSLWW